MSDVYDPYTGGYHEDVHPADMEDLMEYFKYQEQRSVDKECERCGNMVHIPEDYAYCGRCADAIESGLEG